VPTLLRFDNKTVKSQETNGRSVAVSFGILGLDKTSYGFLVLTCLVILRMLDCLLTGSFLIDA
jgi:hypothetical protein